LLALFWLRLFYGVFCVIGFQKRLIPAEPASRRIIQE
jgi:hypothetical protein